MNSEILSLCIKVKREMNQRKLGPYAESRVGIAHALNSTYFSTERKHLPLPLPAGMTSVRCILKLGSEVSTMQSNISETSAYKVLRYSSVLQRWAVHTG